jgi:hypothetical protein
MNGKKKFLKQFKDEKFKFSGFANWMKCFKCCKEPENKALRIGGKVPRVRNATDPSLLIWENLGKSNRNRCVLSTIVTMFSLIIVLCGFYVITALVKQDIEAK